MHVYEHNAYTQAYLCYKPIDLFYALAYNGIRDQERGTANKRNNHDYKRSEHKQVANPLEILREYQLNKE